MNVSPLKSSCKWLGTIIVASAFLLPFSALAQSFPSQPDISDSLPSNNGVFFPNGVLDGQTITSITQTVDVTSVTGTVYLFEGLGACDQDSGTECSHRSGNYFPTEAFNSPFGYAVSSPGIYTITQTYPAGLFATSTGFGYILQPIELNTCTGVGCTATLVSMGQSGGATSQYFNLDSGNATTSDSNSFAFNGLGETATRIIDFTPEASTTPISSPVNFSLHVYVNPADLGTFSGISVSFQNIDQNSLFSTPYDYNFLINAPLSAGDFYYASSSVPLPNGNYQVSVHLQTSYLGLFDLPLQNESHNFIVGAPTFVGNFSQNGFSDINSLFASTSATSTASALGSCNPLGGNFSTVTCLGALFVPDAGLIYSSLQSFASQGGTHFPIGYLTDFISILSTTTTPLYPDLPITLPPGLGVGSGLHADLTISSTTFDYIYDATLTPQFYNSNASSSETFFDTTNYYWEILNVFLVIMYLLSRLVGSRIFGNIMSRK